MSFNHVVAIPTKKFDSSKRARPRKKCKEVDTAAGRRGNRRRDELLTWSSKLKVTSAAAIELSARFLTLRAATFATPPKVSWAGRVRQGGPKRYDLTFCRQSESL